MGAFFDVALPAFLLVFAGAVAACADWIDEAGAKGLNAFVYYLAMPAALFRAASEGALVQGFDWRVVAAYFGPTLVLLAAVEALGRRGALDPGRHAACGAADGRVPPLNGHARRRMSQTPIMVSAKPGHMAPGRSSPSSVQASRAVTPGVR